jgi:hypothetical protein
MRFEYPAFVVVNAETREEADYLSRGLVDATANSGAAYIVLDDGEPSIEDDESEETL